MQPTKPIVVAFMTVACVLTTEFLALRLYNLHYGGGGAIEAAHPDYLQQSMAITCPARILVETPWATPCGQRPLVGRKGKKHSIGCVMMGTAYGGYEMPDPLCFLNPGDVYYGFGVGEDMSYDLVMLAKYNLTVRLFDPTPRPVEHVEAVKTVIDSGKPPSATGSTYKFKGETREISGNYPAQDFFTNVIKLGIDSQRIIYRPWALGAEDGLTQFTPPSTGVSHVLKSGKDAFNVTARSIQSIMEEFGDEKVSILKMDIEGHEVHVIPQLVKMWETRPRSQWPRVLVIDMDSRRDGHPNKDEQKGNACIALLKGMGYIEFSLISMDLVLVLGS